MRSLSDITSAVRSGKEVTEEELKYAVCGYDVLISLFKIDQHPILLDEYFKATEGPVDVFVGPNNSPFNKDAVDWYKTFIKVEGE